LVAKSVTIILNSKHIVRYLLWGIFAIACYFPLFLHLDSLPLSIYDEAKRAVSSLEMLERQDFLVTYYNGAPDMVGTKPPLLNWLQAFWMTLLGYHEVAVRLPSALAGLATALLLLFVGIRWYRLPVLGVVSAIILLCLPGYVAHHVTRTGDFDALLTLFTTGYLFSFFRYTETNASKWLYWTAVGILLAVLTKGVAGLFFGPVLLGWLLYHKKGVQLLQNKAFYFSALIVIIGVGAFYSLREWYNPGYLQAVWNNELGGRFLDTIDTHKYPWSFYWSNLWDFQLGIWRYILPIGVLAWWHDNRSLRILAGYLVFALLFLLLLLSSAETKLIWYNAPIFPLLALWLAIGIHTIYTRIIQANKSWTLPIAIVLFGLLALPYALTLQNVYTPDPPAWADQSYERFMRAHPALQEYRVSTIGFSPGILFYQKALNARGSNIGTFYPKQRREEGQLFLLCEERAKRLFRVKHQLENVQYWEDCELVRVVGYNPKPYQWPEGEEPWE
jgi:4-amino-4-deoxy-L-arabinose transferase-like glycosyltransferase